MSEMLEPVLGATLATVVQFLAIMAIIALLIGLGVWLFMRLFGNRFPGNGRGRPPRLAVIDSVPVGGRRKLVLVRRDNVEHLLLIGGSSDVLVEPSIPRPVAAGARSRPQQAPQPQQAAQPQIRPETRGVQAPQRPSAEAPIPPPRPASTGISEPIPFPPQAPHALQRPANGSPPAPARRPVIPPPPPVPAAEAAPQRRAATRPAPAESESLAATEPPVVRPISASARFEEPSRPTRVESIPARAERTERAAAPPPPPPPPPPPAPMAAREEEIPAEPEPPLVPEAPSRPAELEALPKEPRNEEPPTAYPDAAAVELARALDETVAPEETREPEETPADDGDRAAKVSDLEKEMARLLGEITSRRES